MIRMYFSKNSHATTSKVSLPQVTMIFHEVLRLYPPIAMLARAVYKDTQVGDMCFPAGVQVRPPS